MTESFDEIPPSGDASPGQTPRSGEIPGPDSVRPDTVLETDLHLPVPEWTMWPLAAAVSVLFVAGFGFDPVLIPLVPFAVMLSIATVIDLRELRIPNRLLGPSAVLAVPLLAAGLWSDWPDLSLIRAVLGAVILGSCYLILGLISPAGMGMGDIKLSPLIGAQLAWFGWNTLFRGAVAAFFIIGPVAVVLLIVGRAGRKTGLPFGPFMAAGAVLSIALVSFGFVA